MVRSQRISVTVAFLLAALGGPAATPAVAGTRDDAPAALPLAPPAPPAMAVPGDTLFTDDFRTLDAWHADRDSVWSVEDGVLCGHLPDGKQERSFLFTGSEDWQD